MGVAFKTVLLNQQLICNPHTSDTKDTRVSPLCVEFVVQTQGLPPIAGALLFPGFVIPVLLGLELATGNFAILPPAVAAGETRIAPRAPKRDCALKRRGQKMFVQFLSMGN